MQRQPLPRLVDARKFAAIGTEIAATEPVVALARFKEGLASDRGVVEVDFHFYRDQQGFYRLDGKLNTDVDVVCERCLQAMAIGIEADFQLAIVWTDEQAKALPKSLDPLLVGEEGLVLAELLQDELILNTPFVNYHDVDQCPAPNSAEFAPAADEVEVKTEGSSPFSVLGQLKPKD